MDFIFPIAVEPKKFTLLNMPQDEIKKITDKIKIIAFDEDETEKKKIESIYRKANKSCIDWASLFVYSYNVLNPINHYIVKERLKILLSPFKKISSNLEEHNRDLEYGRHYYYNSIKDDIFEHLVEVMEIVEFTFTKILNEDNMLSGLEDWDK